jgi:acyl carrier protein
MLGQAMKTETDIKSELREWISSASKKAEKIAIRDDTPIIEQRIITSLQVMDLILYIEQLTDASIDVEDLKPGVFKDVNTIYRNFFEASHDN